MAKSSPEKLAAALRANLKRRKLAPGQKTVKEPPSAGEPSGERLPAPPPKPPKNSA